MQRVSDGRSPLETNFLHFGLSELGPANDRTAFVVRGSQVNSCISSVRQIPRNDVQRRGFDVVQGATPGARLAVLRWKCSPESKSDSLARFAGSGVTHLPAEG
jgi:hypothetical protein